MVGYATKSFYFSHHLLTICFRGMSCAAMLLYTAMLDFTRKWDFTLSSETETQQLHWQTLPLVFRILTSSLALYLTTVFLKGACHKIFHNFQLWYILKCSGKHYTTWNIPRSITFSPLHFMVYRGKSIAFGTVCNAKEVCTVYIYCAFFSTWKCISSVLQCTVDACREQAIAAFWHQLYLHYFSHLHFDVTTRIVVSNLLPRKSLGLLVFIL